MLQLSFPFPCGPQGWLIGFPLCFHKLWDMCLQTNLMHKCQAIWVQFLSSRIIPFVQSLVTSSFGFCCSIKEPEVLMVKTSVKTSESYFLSVSQFTNILESSSLGETSDHSWRTNCFFLNISKSLFACFPLLVGRVVLESGTLDPAQRGL